jgi:hypothetical protein
MFGFKMPAYGEGMQMVGAFSLNVITTQFVPANSLAQM